MFSFCNNKFYITLLLAGCGEEFILWSFYPLEHVYLSCQVHKLLMSVYTPSNGRLNTFLHFELFISFFNFLRAVLLVVSHMWLLWFLLLFFSKCTKQLVALWHFHSCVYYTLFIFTSLSFPWPFSPLLLVSFLSPNSHISVFMLYLSACLSTYLYPSTCWEG